MYSMFHWEATLFIISQYLTKAGQLIYDWMLTVIGSDGRIRVGRQVKKKKQKKKHFFKQENSSWVMVSFILFNDLSRLI